MSASFCGCGGSTNGNTGTVTGKGVTFKKTVSMILVQKYDSTGALNEIKESDFVNGVLPESFKDDMIYNSDPSKRWHPINQLETVDSVRGDRALSSAETGENTQTTAVAIRPFSAMVSYGGCVFLRNLERFACDQLAVFLIDNCGTLKGEVKRTDLTNLRPLAIAINNWYPNEIWAQGDENGMVNIQFEFDSRVRDSNCELIPAGNMDFDACDLDGLLNLVPDNPFTNITATTFTATLRLEYGPFAVKRLQTGLVITDFVIYNVTTDSVIAGAVAESSTGVYEFAIPAQTAADVIELRQATTGVQYTKQGFELVVQSFVAV